jgi:hypothetical protein
MLKKKVWKISMCKSEVVNQRIAVQWPNKNEKTTNNDGKKHHAKLLTFEQHESY